MKESFERFYRLLKMISQLKAESPVSVSVLAKRFDTSERTIYRHLQLLEDCGFSVEKDQKNRYYISSSGREDPYAAQFTSEEATLLKDAVLAMHSEHPLRNILLKKLFILSDLNEIAEILYEKTTGENLNNLLKAIKERKKVLLVGYSSVNSGTVTDRKVIPLGFVQNMKYLIAYDTGKKKELQFKPDRIGEVKILDESFEPGHLNENLFPDAFGMRGESEFIADIFLYPRAYHLLKEEFPLAAGECRELNEGWYLTVKVRGFEGIGRFCLGLPGEVIVEGPPELIEYLDKKARKKISKPLKDFEERERIN